jgi:hypothetical protein
LGGFPEANVSGIATVAGFRIQNMRTEAGFNEDADLQECLDWATA